MLYYYASDTRHFTRSIIEMFLNKKHCLQLSYLKQIMCD